MKKTLAVIVLLLAFLPMFAQVDTLSQGKAGVTEAAQDDGSFLLFLMVFMAGCIAIFFFSVLGVLALAGVALVLIAAGIITSSIFVGWYRRSVYSGVKWFIYATFAAAGACGGVVISLLLYYFGSSLFTYKKWLGYGKPLVWGIPIGIVSGLLSAWILVKISRMVYDRYMMKNKITA